MKIRLTRLIRRQLAFIKSSQQGLNLIFKEYKKLVEPFMIQGREGRRMLHTLVSFYLQGLLLATIFVFIAGLAYMVSRAYKKVDKTARERQEVLYDILMICILTIPIFSFAFMALLLVLKS